MSARRVAMVLGGLAVVVLLAGCAAGANPAQGTGDPAGFWLGLWHGFICPVTLVVSFFNHNVNVYEVANNGGWYNAGFVIGASAIFGGGGGGASARSRRR